jgi:hypothetical protein
VRNTESNALLQDTSQPRVRSSNTRSNVLHGPPVTPVVTRYKSRVTLYSRTRGITTSTSQEKDPGTGNQLEVVKYREIQTTSKNPGELAFAAIFTPWEGTHGGADATVHLPADHPAEPVRTRPARVGSGLRRVGGAGQVPHRRGRVRLPAGPRDRRGPRAARTGTPAPSAGPTRGPGEAPRIAVADPPRPDGRGIVCAGPRGTRRPGRETPDLSPRGPRRGSPCGLVAGREGRDRPGPRPRPDRPIATRPRRLEQCSRAASAGYGVAGRACGRGGVHPR